jgi:hypothetical protein
MDSGEERDVHLTADDLATELQVACDCSCGCTCSDEAVSEEIDKGA